MFDPKKPIYEPGTQEREEEEEDDYDPEGELYEDDDTPGEDE